MLYYDRINLSEGTDLVKSNDSKEYMVWHYWFVNHGFKPQHFVCNGCHDLTLLFLNFSDIAIVAVKVLITVVLLMALTDLKQFIYQKILYWMIVGMDKMHTKKININIGKLKLIYINIPLSLCKFNRTKKNKN